MNRVSAVLLSMMLVGGSAIAQQKPADNKTAPQTTQAQPAAPAGPKLAKAKNKEEYAAFKAADGLGDPAALEQAADSFAQKYADSELRVVLYTKAMSMYQQANAADKTVEMGRKALAIEPDEPVTLITVGNVLAERTRDTDLDKDERLKDSIAMSERGLANIDKMQAPQGVPAEQLKNAKDELRSIALGTMGFVAYMKKDFPTAEKQFKAAIDAFTLQPDPALYLRLTLTLDSEKKYAEALDWANKALKISPAGTPFVQLANNEIERLKKLSGSAAK